MLDRAQLGNRGAGRRAAKRSPTSRAIIASTACRPQTRRYLERAANTKKGYGGFFPSFNATYNFTEKLLGRVSYARSIARPEFSNILPSLNLPDAATTSRVITLTNPNLKPWTANSYGVALEYYFEIGRAHV